MSASWRCLPHCDFPFKLRSCFPSRYSTPESQATGFGDSLQQPETMPVALVELKGLAVSQGWVSAIRLTLQAPANLQAKARETEYLRTVVGETASPQIELLNGHADAAQEQSMVRPLALAGDMRAQKVVPPVQGTGSEIDPRWMFEEHCPCLDIQSPSFWARQSIRSLVDSDYGRLPLPGVSKNRRSHRRRTDHRMIRMGCRMCHSFQFANAVLRSRQGRSCRPCYIHYC